MPDDPRYRSATSLGLPSRRPGTVSDGTPHRVDNDVTPPPAVLPHNVYEMPLADQVRLNLAATAANSRALLYEQDQRNEARRHGESIAKLAADFERVEPALQRAFQTSVIVDEMRREQRDMRADVQTLVKAQERDEERRTAVDEKFERLLREIGAVNETARRTETRVEVHAERLDNLDEMHGVALKRIGAVETAHAQLDKRHAVTRAKLGWRERGVVGGLGTVAGIVGHFISEGLSWLSAHFH